MWGGPHEALDTIMDSSKSGTPHPADEKAGPEIGLDCKALTSRQPQA